MTKLTVVLQMDPVDKIRPRGDSTYALGLEAAKRGHELFYYPPEALAYRDGKVGAKVRPLTLREDLENYCTLGEEEDFDLAKADVILLRQDPPFDMGYLTTTYILEQLPDNVLVVNNPAEVRNAPEKLLVMQYPDLMPETLITADRAKIRAFREEFGDIIIKPLYGNGGAGVFRLKADDGNFSSLMETYEKLYREPLVVQRFVPEVSEGDKRILLVDGEVTGWFARKSSGIETRSNLHIGGHAEACEFTKRDAEICERLKPVLKAKGLTFTGIDVLGNYITEINVTSPTGIWESRGFGQEDTAVRFWDVVEKKASSR